MICQIYDPNAVAIEFSAYGVVVLLVIRAGEDVEALGEALKLVPVQVLV